MEEKVDYYKVGNKDDIVVSSSSLKHIDPERGGSPQDFLRFLEEGFGETPSMKVGSLIHAWHEDKENFKIAEVVKPSEKAGQIADEIIRLVNQGNVYTEALIEEVIDRFEYQKNWKQETRINKIIEQCEPYINEVIGAIEDNQVFLTATQLEPVQNACEAIEKHPVANDLLFYSETGFDNVKSFTEIEIYWEEEVILKQVEKPITVKLKAKLDKLILDFDKKIATVVDLKTTSRGAYHYGETNFKQYKTYQQLGFYSIAAGTILQQKYKLSLEELDNWNFRGVIVSVETNKTQQCVVYEVDNMWISKGVDEILKLLKRVAWHQFHNKWSYSIEEEKNGYILNISYVEGDKS